MVPLVGVAHPCLVDLNRLLASVGWWGQGLGSWKLPLPSDVPVLLFSRFNSRPPSHGDLRPLGSFGKASLGQSPHVACLPPEGTQSCGVPFLSPTHPTQDQQRVPLPAQLGLGTSYSRPGLPSINSRLHTHVFLPLSTCMGRAVPRPCALERGPLFFSWLWGIQAVGICPLFWR